MAVLKRRYQRNQQPRGKFRMLQNPSEASIVQRSFEELPFSQGTPWYETLLEGGWELETG